MNLAVEAAGLVKSYGKTLALDGLDLAVREGTVLGLLGPNGAGKTTAVRIFATLHPADQGTARVAGFDVASQAREVRRRIGLTGQYAAVDQHLTGQENLVMIGRLNGLSRPDAVRRADDLLARFDLTDAGGRPSKTYSGGMRRRLDLAASLVLLPSVLFLDEPTTGLDPVSRRALWEVIRQIVGEGTTVLLTTQDHEEADALADEIVVIDQGRAIASGTPRQLKSELGGERIDVAVKDPDDTERAHAVLAPFAGEDLHVDPARGTLSFPILGDHDLLPRTVRALDDAGIRIQELSLRSASLDDVFLALTGHTAMGRRQ